MHMQQDKNPLVSVAMGVFYRREDLSLLKRSVDSILNQTFSDFEFLICDDGSTNEAKQFLDLCAEQDNRIRIIRPGDKFDLASKLNACIKEAHGKYIARMDDDDYSIPKRFQIQLDFIEANENIAFVGSNVSLNREGAPSGERILPEYPTVEDFFMTQPYIHPALMFRKDALFNVGCYSENKHQLLCEDYDLLLRLYAKDYTGMNIQENLLEYTIPITAKGNRKMHHRLNETITRYERFKELGKLPSALPYVVKPIAVGLVPEILLKKIKR